MTDSNQRRFSRLLLEVSFRARDSEGVGTLQLDGTDLSLGGTFIKSDILLEVGERLLLEFRLNNVPRPLRAHAKVAWVRRFPKENEAPGMGIEFVSMTDEDRVELNRYFQHSREPGANS